MPVRLWHGVRDSAVPVRHGRWLAAHVPSIPAGIADIEDHTNVEQAQRRAAFAWLSDPARVGH